VNDRGKSSDALGLKSHFLGGEGNAIRGFRSDHPDMTLNQEFTSIVRPNVLIVRAAKVPASHYEETIAGTLTHSCADPWDIVRFGRNLSSPRR
jgi:hypothetical protein